MNSTRPKAIVLSALVVFFYLYWLWRLPAGEEILVPVDGVTEITLVYDSTNAGPIRGPVMGLDYARWVNFTRVLFQGESFNQAGSGASLITKDTRPTRYVVREAYRLKSGPFGKLRYATLVIQDSQTNAVVASKEWRCATTECRDAREGEQGWPGQQAALFVRKALNPSLNIGGNVGIKPYPRTTATVDLRTPSEPFTRATLATRAFDCPADLTVYVRKDINQMVVSRPGWIFATQQQARQIRCTHTGFFIFSTTFPEDANLDWLSPDGELLAQYHTRAGGRFPASGGGTFPFFAGIQVDPEHITIRMVYFHDRWPSEEGGAELPQWESLAKVSRAASAQRHAP